MSPVTVRRRAYTQPASNVTKLAKLGAVIVPSSCTKDTKEGTSDMTASLYA